MRGRPTPRRAFEVGDRVHTLSINPETTRACRATHAAAPGVIECVRGFHVFPDTVAIGEGEKPQWLYTVLFDGRELWARSTDPTLKLSIEAWEPYLEPELVPRSEVRDTLQRALTRTSETRGTSNSIFLVPLFDLRFLTEFAASGVGTFKSAALA